MRFDLERFVTAQDEVYPDVLEQLGRGLKTGHWMWFTFPQVAGLGQSAMSQHYAISSLEEAQAYLEHPILGARLRECVALVLAIDDRTAEEIFGPIDARKLRSSATLFHRAAPEDGAIAQLLAKYDDGVADAATDAILMGLST